MVLDIAVNGVNPLFSLNSDRNIPCDSLLSLLAREDDDEHRNANMIHSLEALQACGLLQLHHEATVEAAGSDPSLCQSLPEDP